MGLKDTGLQCRNTAVLQGELDGCGLWVSVLL